MRIAFTLWMAVLLLNVSCSHQEHKKPEKTKLVITSPVRKDTVIYKEYVCQIHSAQHIELRALEKGYIQNIYVDEGQRVKQGQMMFQIMPVVYRAEMEKANAEVKFAEIEYANTKALADSNIVSQNELAMSMAQLNKARAELALAKAHLGFTEVRAPFDGIMDRLHVRKGSLVDEGELLTMLSDNSKMWVYFNVPETEYLDYITREKENEPTQVKLVLANHQFFPTDGIVETIQADFNNETGNIAFRATFPNPKGILRHGETGNVLMPIPLNDAVIIPQKATFEILDKKYVFTVDENNVVKSKEITIKAEVPHLYIVDTGITERDKIVAEGLRKVKNNDRIESDFVDQKTILAELGRLRAE